MIEVLLVEDDPVLGRSVKLSLELEGYKVRWATDLKSAAFENERAKLDLIVLDLGLPDGSGLSFLKKIRADGSRVSVVILTAQTDEDSVVEGLQSGANDYVRKPFGFKELLARIKTALREPQKREHQIRFGDLLILIDQRKVMFGEKEIEFKRREFDVLRCLIENATAVVSRDNLLDAVGREAEVFDRTIDSHVSHIRLKLKNAEVSSILINSVYGIGYRLEKK
jgi:DNA-binding response OmpR family regulator